MEIEKKFCPIANVFQVFNGELIFPCKFLSNYQLWNNLTGYPVFFYHRDFIFFCLIRPVTDIHNANHRVYSEKHWNITDENLKIRYSANKHSPWKNIITLNTNKRIYPYISLIYPHITSSGIHNLHVAVIQGSMWRWPHRRASSTVLPHLVKNRGQRAEGTSTHHRVWEDSQILGKGIRVSPHFWHPNIKSIAVHCLLRARYDRLIRNSP